LDFRLADLEQNIVQENSTNHECLNCLLQCCYIQKQTNYLSPNQAHFSFSFLCVLCKVSRESPGYLVATFLSKCV